MQFEDCNAEILKSGEFDLGPGGNLVEMRREFGFDLIVVDAHVGFIGGP